METETRTENRNMHIRTFLQLKTLNNELIELRYKKQTLQQKSM